MLQIIDYALFALAVVLLIPVVVLALEITAGCASRNRLFPQHAGNDARPRIAVLIPAHNEGSGLLPTLSDIVAQVLPGDSVLVVADNCTDDTASVAIAGAQVIVRNNQEKIGKGYALDWGVRHLEADPPAIVIVVDADCRLEPGAIEQLVTLCRVSGRPAQSLYLMVASPPHAIDHCVAEFAWRVKNWVRPLGLRALGLPCQLMGTGMAFPWEALRKAELASGEIVEDLKLGLDLAAAGAPPLFCPTAVVMSGFAATETGAAAQRQRWEHGHIRMMLTAAPRYFVRALVGRNLGLFALALDVIVPPVVALGLLLGAGVVVTGLAVIFGASWLPFAICITTSAAFMGAMLLSWVSYGRDILPPRKLLLLGRYLFAKLLLYRRLFSAGFVTQWIRTDRNLRP